MSNTKLSNNKFFWTSATVILLLIVSLLPRGYELGKIGLQKDEEYTAFVASAIAKGQNAELPSGMPYRRALPLSYLSAGTALLFGTENEISYRLPATVAGVLLPVLLFLLLRSTIGGTAALIAALMLAFSEWHILVSREARMYAPFLLFYTCTALYTWQWVKSNKRRYLLISIALFTIGITLHKLAIFAAIFALIPLVTNSKTAVTPTRAVFLFVIFIVFTSLYYNFFVSTGYEMFVAAEPGTRPYSNFGGVYTEFLKKIPVANSALTLLLLTVGAATGYWLAEMRRTGSGKIKPEKLNVPLLNIFAYYSLAIITGIFTFIGLIYAATLTGVLFFAIKTDLPPTRLQKIWWPLGLLISITLFWVGFSVLQYGLHDGIKNISGFPFPYLSYFILISPGILLLFICACAYLFLNYKNTPEMLRFSVIATIVPVFAIGSVQDWGAARYIFGIYPFLIIAASLSLVMFIELIGNRTGWWSKRGTALLAIVITTSGILGGNGIPSSILAATFDYGEPDYWPTLVLSGHPDHQSAGRFVSDRIQASDIVVAEDASMQKWYAGKVDFWLRNYKDAKAYLYRADDGYLRDIYVSSRIVTPEVLTKLDAMAISGQRIWVITSAETYKKRSYYLSKQQLQWLDKIELTLKPAHIGRDGITKVYCLGCEHNREAL